MSYMNLYLKNIVKRWMCYDFGLNDARCDIVAIWLADVKTQSSSSSSMNSGLQCIFHFIEENIVSYEVLGTLKRTHICIFPVHILHLVYLYQ